MMLWSRKNEKKTYVVLGFQCVLSLPGGKYAKTHNPGIVPKHLRVVRNTPIELRNSVFGNFGVGITNPAS